VLEFLLWLLFLGDFDLSSGEVQWPPHFPNVATPLLQLVFLLLIAALIAGAIWLYRREPGYVGRKRKRTLSTLRIAGGLLLIFILSGAFLDVHHRDDRAGSILLLVDSSESMSIKDKLGSVEERTHAEQVLGRELTQDGEELTPSRRDLVQAALSNTELGLLKNLGERFHIETYSFGHDAQVNAVDLPEEQSDLELPAAEAKATQIGGALRDVARRLKGRRAAGVLMFTDGGWNRGEDPTLVARDLGVPVYTVGVGLPEVKDLEIPFLSAEDIVFKGDKFSLNVRLRQSGYERQPLEVVVRRDDVVVHEETVQMGEQRELIHSIEIEPEEVPLATLDRGGDAAFEFKHSAGTRFLAHLQLDQRTAFVLQPFDQDLHPPTRFLAPVQARRYPSAAVVAEDEKPAAGAGIDDLARVPGISSDLARKIYNHFHQQ